MAQHFSCKCPERKKPIMERAWVVTQYKYNTGTFTKAGGEYSQYSTVRCLECGSIGRSKAGYVESLKLMDFIESTGEHQKRKNQVNING